MGEAIVGAPNQITLTKEKFATLIREREKEGHTNPNIEGASQINGID